MPEVSTPVQMMRLTYDCDECGEERRIVEEHEEERAYLDAHLHVNGGRLDGLRFAVQSLGAVYADHPDYRPGWRL